MRRRACKEGRSRLALVVCAQAAHAALFDDDEARKRIVQTNTRIDQLQADLETRLGALEQQLKNQGLDLLREVEGIKSDVARIRGQIEVLVYELAEAQKRQRDLYVDIDSRMRKLESAPGAAVAPPLTDAGAAAPPAGSLANAPAVAPPAPAADVPSLAVPATPPAASEQRAYDAALDQFKRGDYPGAIAGFQAFVKTYPRSPLAASAQYWVGNAQFARKDYRGAIVTQRQLLQLWPDNAKVPDALLNIASAQSELATTSGAPHARGTDRQVPAIGVGGEGEAAARDALTRDQRSGIRDQNAALVGKASALREPSSGGSLPHKRSAMIPAISRPSFSARVIAWQRTHGRHDLPWQRTRDPYRIWLSEIMLQQTQVAAVVPYFLRFVAAFPDVAALAGAPIDAVLAHWSGLGYYRRAHHLHAAAQAIMATHAGAFRATPRPWRRCPASAARRRRRLPRSRSARGSRSSRAT
jgi:tol-pal system protein YbgF